MAHRKSNVYFGLTWFDKQSEELVGEISLHANARELRHALRLPPRTSLLASFPISSRHVSALKALTSHPLNFKQFDYFIEASSEPIAAHEEALG